MLKTLTVAATSSCTALFYGLRSGCFGVNKVTFVDTKEFTNFVQVKKTFLYDELHSCKTERVDALLAFKSFYDEDIPAFKPMPVLTSIKPLEYEVERYDKAGDLEKKMAERVDNIYRSYQDYPKSTRELLARDSLTRLVSEYK
jgi:hypothetical protein